MKDRLREIVVPSWLSGYGREALGQDALAGAILAILLIPQSMAYALLAGLPPEAGLYTAMVAPLVYAVLGGSAHVSLGPVALVSLLVADALAGSDLEPMAAAVIIAVETGAMLLLLGLVRLGRLVNFVSEPALFGFTAAAAVLIAASQLPPLLGLDADRSGNLLEAGRAILDAGSPHLKTAVVGIAALALLLLADRYAAPVLWRQGVRPPWRMAIVKSAPLLVILAATFAALMLGDGIQRVSPPKGGLPDIGVSLRTPEAWLSLLQSSAVVAIIVFVTGTAVAKSLSSRRRQALDTNREAIALGAANIATGLTGGYATGVSLSRSALVYDSGAYSPLASAIAAMVVLPVVLFAAPLLAMMPEAALAALVISAIFGLIKTREIRGVWRHSRAEGTVLALTFLATVGLGVQWGLLVGAVAGLAAFLWFSSQPRVTRIGSSGKPGFYRSIDRQEVELDTLPVLAIRIDRAIYFGNAGHCEERINDFVARHPEAQALLLDMVSVNDIDASGIRMLTRLVESMRENDVVVGFAALHQPVRIALGSSGPARTSPHFMTVDDGIRELRKRCGADPQPKARRAAE